MKLGRKRIDLEGRKAELLAGFLSEAAVYTILPMRAEMPGSDLDQALSIFQSLRPRMFGIAYRMLGSAAEAEDIVQDAWLRWQSTAGATVQEPTAFLITVVTRLSINALQSARTQRETYIGPWLPEPVDTSQDPYLGAERSEALEMGILLLLEKLSPTERAAYVLREAFDYPYGQLAALLETTEANCRQLVARARKHIASERRTAVDPATQRRLFDEFLAAAQAGDVQALEKLFAADVVSLSDGGGLVNAARIPVVGRERVAKFIGAFASHFWLGVTLHPIQANGQPAVLLMRGEAPLAVASLYASAEGIDQVLWMMHPAKLAGISSAVLSQN